MVLGCQSPKPIKTSQMMFRAKSPKCAAIFSHRLQHVIRTNGCWVPSRTLKYKQANGCWVPSRTLKYKQANGCWVPSRTLKYKQAHVHWWRETSMESNEANYIHFNAGFVQMSLNWLRLSLCWVWVSSSWVQMYYRWIWLSLVDYESGCPTHMDTGVHQSSTGDFQMKWRRITCIGIAALRNLL